MSLLRLKHAFVAILCLVVLSACSSRISPAPVSTLYTGSTTLKRNKDTINTSSYIVKKGETLFSIAWRANSDVKYLARLNHLTSPYKIYPSQKLLLVEPKIKKTPKVSKSKVKPPKLNKNSTVNNNKRIKNTLASSKKQGYGKIVTKSEIVRNPPSKSDFTKKITQWQWPVKGNVIDSFSNKAQGNKGLDIAGRRGTKIRSAATGKVVYAGNALRGYGKLIIIKHNDDYLSAYAHNDRILVKERQQINRGDVIATMGDSDASTVMLHFEIRYKGKSVNPEKYLPKK